MRFLIAIKNLFAKQLPKMPKEYIVRLLFDQEHKCMVILKNKEEIIGGVCYKLFKSQEFAEIVFLAISNSQQIQGYGTRLMNRYKEIMQEIGIKMLLTYADNSAIGFFLIFPTKSKNCRVFQKTRIFN